MDRLISNDFGRQALRKESHCVKVSWPSRKPIPSFSATVQVVFCYSKSECSQSSHHTWLPSRRHETLYKFPCVQSWHATSQPLSSPWQMRTKCSWVRWRKEGKQQRPGAAEVLSAEAGDAEAFLEEEGPASTLSKSQRQACDLYVTAALHYSTTSQLSIFLSPPCNYCLLRKIGEF